MREASCHEAPWEHFAWNPIIPDTPGAEGSTNGYGERDIEGRVSKGQKLNKLDR